MAFNATVNNISVISWRPVLLVEETGVPRETHRSSTKHLQTLSHNVVSSAPHLRRIRTRNVIDVTHGIGDTALIHFKISMRLLIFIEVRPIIYQKLQNFANINNFMLK